MGRFLILDIGAGTMDVLCYDTESGLHYKAVVKSPVLAVAEKAAGLPGNLVVTGTEMGGGAISKVLIERAKQAKVVMSASAAATVHHDPEKVRSRGIQVVDDEEAERIRRDPGYSTLSLGDIDRTRLERIVEGFGIPFSFDVVGACAQDHGVPPEGISHLDYRHRIFKAGLDQSPFPHTLLYRDHAIPESFNRLRAISESIKPMCREVYVMDSGMAAIQGASMDPQVTGKKRFLVLDVATSHTVGAAMQDGEIAGFFEYHTQDITLERIEQLLPNLAEGRLEHRRILAEGGHGAYIRKGFEFSSAEIILATGPKRRLLEQSRLPIRPGAPLGDNMMTGTAGVLEAIRRRKGFEPISSWS
jgi:uncharacterized protein (DUF1786 family)